MSFNNEFWVRNLTESETFSSGPAPRKTLRSAFCLPERLPNERFLKREADQSGPREILRQLRHSPSPKDAEESEITSASRSTSPPQPTRRNSQPTTPPAKPSRLRKSHKPSNWKEPQPFEVFRAIENKDIMFLMQVRDYAFPLLLKRMGDATPLVHAMRIGQSHRDVTIILLGAFSRWVNHLDDDEILQPGSKILLKALRTNLKLAIDHGLATSQSDLIPSFLQTLVMSEGDRWVHTQVESVSLALRAGADDKPVSTARSAVRAFATRELGKAESIAALEDYVANATADLLMLAAWSQLRETVTSPTEPIPIYYFARDDRIYKAFEDRLRTTKQNNATKRLRWQLRVISKVMEGRNVTYRQKVDLLEQELDVGPGV